MKVLLVANGADPVLTAGHVRGVELIVAVDGGLRHLTAASLVPTLLVGDLDSLSPQEVAAAEARGTEVVRHPADKNHTDLELALALAKERGATEIAACGVNGGRVDHFLVNMAVLAHPSLAGIDVTVVEPEFRGWVVRNGLEPPLPPGATVSVIALGGPATVSIVGMRWELLDHTLDALSGLGLSNEVLSSDAHIEVTSGVVLVVAPTP